MSLKPATDLGGGRMRFVSVDRPHACLDRTHSVEGSFTEVCLKIRTSLDRLKVSNMFDICLRGMADGGFLLIFSLAGPKISTQ